MSRYTWDPVKAESNLRRHGITFEEAEAVLDSPLAMGEPDEVHSLSDMRRRVTGWSASNRLIVVIVSRLEPRARTISARRATKRERHAYESRP